MSFQMAGVLKKYGLAIVLVFLIIISAIISPLFLSPRNIINLLTQVSFVGILSVGMTVVILTGGIDLSVSSIVGFSSIFFATMLHGKFFTFMPEEIFVYQGGDELMPVLPNRLEFTFCIDSRRRDRFDKRIVVVQDENPFFYNHSWNDDSSQRPGTFLYGRSTSFRSSPICKLACIREGSRYPGSCASMAAGCCHYVCNPEVYKVRFVAFMP